MTAPLWIEIVGWDKFQHYKDRDPVWIKLHLKLLNNDDYLALPVGARLLLIELWMLRGIKGSQLRLDTASLSRQLGHRTTSEQVQRLSDAGFIRLRATKSVPKSLPRGRDIKDLPPFSKKEVDKILKDLR